MDVPYDTLLDLARQRARDVASSPRHTREARVLAASIERSLTAELEAHNKGCPKRKLHSTANRRVSVDELLGETIAPPPSGAAWLNPATY